MRLRGAIVGTLALASLGGVLFGAPRAAAVAMSSRVLAALPFAAQSLTAYDGYVVFSQSSANGVEWHLMVWHAGTIAPLPVPARTVPFDADAGPGSKGQPVVVFSVCAVEPKVLQGETPSGPAYGGGSFGSVLDWSTASGCHIDELGLRGGLASRVTQIDVPGASDTTPTIWRGAIAFARLLAHQHRPPVPEIMLWHEGVPLRRLAGGPRPCRRNGPCGRGTRNASVGAFVASMDLGPHGLAVDWYFEGSNVMDGIGPEWRILQDRLGGGRAAEIADGFVGGACSSINPLSPNEVGDSVVYARDENECEYSPGTPQFETSAIEPGDAKPPAGSYIAAVTEDATTTYWLTATPADPTNEDDYAPVCEPGIVTCALMSAVSTAALAPRPPAASVVPNARLHNGQVVTVRVRGFANGQRCGFRSAPRPPQPAMLAAGRSFLSRRCFCPMPAARDRFTSRFTLALRRGRMTRTARGDVPRTLA